MVWEWVQVVGVGVSGAVWRFGRGYGSYLRPIDFCINSRLESHMEEEEEEGLRVSGAGTLRTRDCWSISRDTFSGRSSESTTWLSALAFSDWKVSTRCTLQPSYLVACNSHSTETPESRLRGRSVIQGYLAHKKQRPPKTLL